MTAAKKKTGSGWGGARPGSGPKKKKPQTSMPADQPASEKDQAEAPSGEPVPTDAKEFLLKVMSGKIVPSIPQLEAAKLLARLEATPVGGKKEQRQEAARKVAGRFAAAAPPKLVAAGGKKV